MPLILFLLLIPTLAAREPGKRVLLDAHNCYPYGGKYADRLDRALAQGLPIAIEQDLAWHRDPVTGRGWSVVSHERKTAGSEPTLDRFFFERIRPIVEGALADPKPRDWPLIVLNLDFKSEEPEHLEAVWQTLSEYKAWLSTAPKGGTSPAKIDWKPVLVLTGVSDLQQKAYHDRLADGEPLLLFGASRADGGMADPATNYRRWWNNPWSAVEAGGQRKALDWSKADRKRLDAMVKHAHRSGLWIRFYTLNGHPEGDPNGWSAGYNFGSIEAARERWKAAVAAKVDFIATDQYEDFSAATGLRTAAAAGAR